MDGRIIEIAELVLKTFIGYIPAKIIYKYSYDLYDTKSVIYDIHVNIIDDNTLDINGIIFKRLMRFKYYFISENGVVYSEFYNKFVIKGFNYRDYPTVSLVDNDGKRSPRKVHRLVYETFIGPLIDGLIIDHKNGKKWCSSSWNLEQIDQRENVRRAYETGLNPTGKWSDDEIHQICKWLECNDDSRTILSKLGLDESEFRNLTMLIHAILNKKYYIEISSNYNLDNYISELNKKDRKLSIEDVKDIKKHLYLNDMKIKELADKYDCSSSTISKIRDNKTWKNIRYGFND